MFKFCDFEMISIKEHLTHLNALGVVRYKNVRC